MPALADWQVHFRKSVFHKASPASTRMGEAMNMNSGFLSTDMRLNWEFNPIVANEKEAP